MNNLIAITWLVINLFLSIVSFSKVRKNPKNVNFIYFWGFITGAFVYEDLFIFGLFHAFSVLVGLLMGDLRYWLLLFIIFWIVRSSGEVLYFFLQQFIQPKHYPHYIGDKLGILRFMFGNISEQKCFILAQVFLQSVLVASIFALVLLLKFW